MKPRYYLSGASAPADLRGLSRILHPLGVAIPELSEPALDYLCGLGHLPLEVFVDTGAFGEVDRTGAVVAPITDAAWADRVLVMHRIAAALGSRALVVAPDRVGDQPETLRRLALFETELRAMAALGVRVVVPIQLGGMSPALFHDACAAILGLPFVAGIPGNKIAMPAGTLENYLRARRPAAVHLLGIGPRGRWYQELVDVLRRFVPGAEVSCDSNGLAAIVGQTNGAGGGPRALTAWQDHLEGQPSPVAAWATGPSEPSAQAREDAIVMALGPALFLKRAMGAYREAGLLAERRERPLQVGLFDDVEGRAA